MYKRLVLYSVGFLIFLMSACNPSVSWEGLSERTVYIKIDFGSGIRICTGVVIEHVKDRTSVLTANHCFKDMESFTATRFNGVVHQGIEVLRLDIRLDLAIVIFKGRFGSKIKLHHKPPYSYEDVWMLSSSRAISFFPTEGRYVGKFRIKDREGLWDLYSLSSFAGMSGAGIFNQYGFLVGIGNSFYEDYPMVTISASISDIKQFLGEH